MSPLPEPPSPCIQGEYHWDQTATTSMEMSVDASTSIGSGSMNTGIDSERPPCFVDEYAGAARTYGRGMTFMDRFDSDEHAFPSL